MPPVVNPDTWLAPICQDVGEVFLTFAVNGAAVAQTNLHQRALCKAEATPLPVKYPRAHSYKSANYTPEDQVV